LARLNRPTQPDRAPSPFESLLDDGAQPTDQPAPVPPENKTAPADTSQTPTKTKDSKPAVANDNGTVKQSNEVDPTDNPDGDNKPAVESKPVVDMKSIEAAVDGDSTKVSDDGKPKDAPKIDAPTITPPADTQTITAADAATVVPTITPQHAHEDKNVVQLPEQASPVAEIATQSKSIDPAQLKLIAGKSADSGKSADAKKQGDPGEQVDTDQSADQPAVDANAAPKSALQPHADMKSQPTTTDGDKEYVAQARGEKPDGANHIAPDPAVSASADAGAATKDVNENPLQPTLTAAPANTAANAATPATPAMPPTPQAAAIPLAGVPLEIASKVLEGKNRFEIRLDPPELGRIEVRLDVDRDGNVTSRLTVDRADILDLLRRDATGLERALQDAGLKTADNGMQFTLRDQSMNQQQTNNGPAPAQLLVTDEILPSIDANLQNYGRLTGQGVGLDIRV
jgi:chemotaxis protein MotD